MQRRPSVAREIDILIQLTTGDEMGCGKVVKHLKKDIKEAKTGIKRDKETIKELGKKKKLKK